MTAQNKHYERKAIGSILGGVFTLLIFSTIITSIVFILNVQQTHDENYYKRLDFDNDKAHEDIEFVSVSKKTGGYLNITVSNKGNVPTQVVYVGEIINYNTIKRDIYHKIESYLNPLETVSDISGNHVHVNENETKELVLLTSYGNLYFYLYDEREDNSTGGSGEYPDPSILYWEDFDDLPPGFDPPDWNDVDGTWGTVDDGTGNIVYYQQDLSEKEALSLNIVGNETWTNYTYSVDARFVEGDPKKDDRGALIVFHYQGGNDYYFLWMKEHMDQLELHNHGDGAHMVASTTCTLAPNTWYSVNITINNNIVNVTIDDVPYFTNVDILGTHFEGTVGLGTRYYRVMFDNLIVKINE